MHAFNIIQLRIYVEQYNVRPSIDDTYQAEAVDGIALNHLYTEKANQLINIVICTQTLGIVVIFASIIMIVACTVTVKSNGLEKFFIKEIKYKSVINKQTFLISLSINSLTFLLYAIAMDGAAIHYRNKTFLSESDVKDELNHLAFDTLYHLPFVTLAFDLAALTVYTGALLIALIYFCAKVDSKGCSVFTLVPSLLGPLLGLISHSPYIAIAYINDSYYASSIFVYYVVIFFICFIAIHLTMRACLRTQLPDQVESNICSKILGNVDKTRTVTCCCLCPAKAKNGQVTHDYVWFLCPIVLSFLLLLFLLSIVVTVICYFVIIPLNGSVSGAPHQLIGFYQSVIIFLGIFITYKTVLHKKHGSLKHAVKNYQMKNETDTANNVTTCTKWENLPGDERITKFHEMVIDLVFHAKNKAKSGGNAIEDCTNTDTSCSGPSSNVGDESNSRSEPKTESQDDTRSSGSAENGSNTDSGHRDAAAELNASNDSHIPQKNEDNIQLLPKHGDS